MKRKKKINTTSIQHESHSQQNKEVSKLNKESTADDIIQAIKHVQRVHDRYQMKLIANYLIDECVDNEYVAYQERSSLLSRLVVAVLHFEYYKVAQHAIKIRQLEYHSSLVPMESAAIIRGLLRTNKLTEAWEVLHDELSLPLEVCTILFVLRVLTSCVYPFFNKYFDITHNVLFEIVRFILSGIFV